MLYPVEAFSSGQFGQMYPSLSPATSLTGWVVLVFAQYTHLRGLFGDSAGFLVAGLVAVPVLMTGFRYAAGALYASASSSRLWFLTTLAVVVPTTWAAWGEYYHPQDVAATGLVLFAIGLAVKHKWYQAGILLGFAILTRHWAILLLPLLLAVSRKDFWKPAITAAVTLAVGIVPLLLTGNEGLLGSLTAANSIITPRTFPGWLVLNTEVSTTAMRSISVLAGLLVAAYAFIKHKTVSFLVPAAALLMFVRVAFETGPYAYYWIPGIACLTLTAIGKKQWLVPAALSTAVVLVLVTWGAVLSPTQTAVFVPVMCASSVRATVLLSRANKTKDTTRQEVTRPSGPQHSVMPWSIAVVVSTAMLAVGLNSAVALVNENESARDLELPGGQEIMFGQPDVVSASPTPFAVGERFPQVRGISPAGVGSTIQAADNETLLVAFWVHWCTQCSDDVAKVLQWADQEGAPVAAVLGPVDQQKSREPQRFWLVGKGWDAPAVVDTQAGATLQLAGFTTYPAYVVVRNGVIVDKWEGPWDPARAGQD